MCRAHYCLHGIEFRRRNATCRIDTIRRDEANLEANEDIKRDLNPTKITEPKTPYRSPLETDDELDIRTYWRRRGIMDDVGGLFAALYRDGRQCEIGWEA